MNKYHHIHKTRSSYFGSFRCHGTQEKNVPPVFSPPVSSLDLRTAEGLLQGEGFPKDWMLVQSVLFSFSFETNSSFDRCGLSVAFILLQSNSDNNYRNVCKNKD